MPTSSVRPPPARALGLCLLTVLTAGLAVAQPASLVVFVRDAATRQPLAGAVVAVHGEQGATGAGGRLRFVGLTPGEVAVQVGFVGYALVDTTVTVADGTGQLNVLLRPSTTALPEVEVEEESLNDARLRRRGFFDRRANRPGVFITRAELVERGATLFADVFTSVSGVRIERGRGSDALVSTRSRGCPMTMFVDGTEAPYLAEQLDSFPLATVAAVEVYRGPSEVPSEYAFTRGRRTCGAVLVWTLIEAD